MKTKTKTFEQACVEFVFRVITDTSLDIFRAHDAILTDAFALVKEYADRGEVPTDFEARFLSFVREQGVSLDDAQ